MKLKSYRKTGYYYIDDEAEDDNGNPFEEKVFEYFFYFDDGIEFVFYIPETMIDDYVFDATNKSLHEKHKTVYETDFKNQTCEQQAAFYRGWLSREFGIENNNFPSK